MLNKLLIVQLMNARSFTGAVGKTFMVIIQSTTAELFCSWSSKRLSTAPRKPVILAEYGKMYTTLKALKTWAVTEIIAKCVLNCKEKSKELVAYPDWPYTVA